MTNAPKAPLNPTCVEINAMRQHNPNAKMSIVSLLISLRRERSTIGIRKMPTTNHNTRKNTI